LQSVIIIINHITGAVHQVSQPKCNAFGTTKHVVTLQNNFTLKLQEELVNVKILEHNPF